MTHLVLPDEVYPVPSVVSQGGRVEGEGDGAAAQVQQQHWPTLTQLQQ